MSIPFKKSLRDFRGFTLVELLVVIGIISILATILLLQLGTARAKSRDAKRIADINQVRSAIEQEFDDVGFYHNTNDMTGLKPKYLSQVPVDPLSSCAPGTTYTGILGGGAQCYGYAYTLSAAAPTRYHIWAQLEQKNRNALGTDADLNSAGWSGAPFDASNPAVSELCPSPIGAGFNCVFDLGL